MDDPIPEGVRRFLLTSIPTVPHLETLLLLWREPGTGWSPEDVARRLYVPVPSAQALLDDLSQADLLVGEGEPKRYGCRRGPPALLALFADLDLTYARSRRRARRSSPPAADAAGRHREREDVVRCAVRG